MTHPFEKSGLGIAPFRCVGVRTNWFEMPGFGRKPGGTCDFCGTGILYEYQIVSSDNKNFVVGCDCVRKTNAEVSGFKKARLEHARELRSQKAAQRREIRLAAYEQKKKEWALNRKAYSEKFVEDNMEICTYLIFYSGKNSFISSMVREFNTYGSLTQNQLNALNKVIDAHEKKRKSVHVGSVGEKLSCSVKVTHSFQSGSLPVYPFSPFWTNVMETEDGNVLTWRTNRRLESCDFSIAKFTVKGHDEYDGISQTQVIRVNFI